MTKFPYSDETIEQSRILSEQFVTKEIIKEEYLESLKKLGISRKMRQTCFLVCISERWRRIRNEQKQKA